jgi:phosphatidylinositol alpha 1,6-mannosyltransferase
MANTHMDGEHPNRSVVFLDNAVPIPFMHDPHHPENSYQLGFALSESVKQKIEEFEPTLIHVTTPDSTCLHLITYARQKEIPLMGTYHSNIPEYMEHYYGMSWLKFILSAFFRHQYNFLQALYVPTPFIHKHLSETSQLDKVTNLGIWGRGIDLERFSPSHRSLKFRRSLGIDDHEVVICWVGRLVPEKRPDIFAHVVRRLHENNVPFRALVIGAGINEDEIKALPNTTFAGWMDGDDLAIAYASSDVFLFPSAVETFGNVTLEAAASGLPLVVEQGCSGHLVQHGINGFACHEDDLEAWYDSTLCLVLDDARRKSMSEAGRAFSMNFEKGVVCRKMLDNYTTVTDEFFTEYGGHHANRDKVYRKPYSFKGGNHPRPVILIGVEYLFILLFQVMYQMATMFFYMRESIFPMRHMEEAAHAESQPVVKEKFIPKTPDATRVVHKTPDVALVSILEGDDETDLESDLQDIPVSAFIGDDSDTETTASISDDSSESTLCRQPTCKISHALSKIFVVIMFFQFRMESNIRNAVSYVCSPSEWTTISTHRKRKDSADRKRKDSADMPMLQRNRSDETDTTDEDSFEMMTCNSTRDDRLNMRRTNSHHLPMMEV